MDDAKVEHACRLLRGALCDDLELKRFVVDVERDGVSIYDLSKKAWRTGKESGRWRKIPRPRMSVCSTSGGSVTADYRGGQRPSRAMRRMPLPAASSASIAAILCAGSA